MYSATGQLLKANCRWYEYTLEPCGTTGRSWAAAMATTRLAYKTKATHSISPADLPSPPLCLQYVCRAHFSDPSHPGDVGLKDVRTAPFYQLTEAVSMATAYRPVLTTGFCFPCPAPHHPAPPYITLPCPSITLPHPSITLPRRAPCVLVFPCSQEDLPTQGPVHFTVSCRQWQALHTAGTEAQGLHGTNPHSCREADTLPSTSGSGAPVTGQAGKEEDRIAMETCALAHKDCLLQLRTRVLTLMA